MASVKQTGPQADWLNWSRREPKKAALKVWSMVQAHERHLGWRHQMAQRGALAWSGMGLGDLFENLILDGPWNAQGRRRRGKLRSDKLSPAERERHARAMIETAIEKLCGMREPKSQLVATDAEWEIRRQGIWADRFVEGNYHLEQGCYRDFWDLARQGAQLSWCATGTAAIRTEPDYVSKCVRNRLRSTLNTFIDAADIGNGTPLSYFDVTWENPEYMCEDTRLTGKDRDRIWKAARIPPHLEQGSYDGPVFNTPMVKVCAAWRRSFGSFKGKAPLFLENDDEPLFWDADFEYLPLAFYRCTAALGDSFWGENAIESALGPLADADDIDDLAKDTMSRTSQTHVNVDGTSKPAAGLLNAKNVNIHRFDSKKQEKPVQIDKPEILNQQYMDWRDRKIQVAHDLVGMPMLHQSSAIQGGSASRSGRSIRLEASLLPERYARRLRNWDNWVAVDCAKNHIRAARAIGKEVPDWQVTWPGADFDAKVSVEVLDLDMEAYTVRPYAVSEQKNTPADRADAAQEMYDRGEINDNQLTVILEGLYDTKRETKASTAQRRYVSKVADEMLYGKQELIADEDVYMRDSYIPPMPWLDAEAAMAQVAPLYLDAMIDGLPQNRRGLLRRFIEDIWALRQQQQKELAMQDASVSIAAKTADPFAGVPPEGMPNGQPGMPPAAPPGVPAPGGMPPGMPPALNAPGAPGMV